MMNAALKKGPKSALFAPSKLQLSTVLRATSSTNPAISKQMQVLFDQEKAIRSKQTTTIGQKKKKRVKDSTTYMKVAWARRLTLFNV